jgi:hypothetical protein
MPVVALAAGCSVAASSNACVLGVLCVQESNSSEALSMLSGLGVCGAADARLQLHSVLAGGKRRVTAEIRQAPQEGAAAALKLHSVSTSISSFGTLWHKDGSCRQHLHLVLLTASIHSGDISPVAQQQSVCLTAASAAGLHHALTSPLLPAFIDT